MNTIPKLKINQIDINKTTDFRDIIFNTNHKHLRFFWNKPDEIEIAGIDYCLKTEYSSIEEFDKLSDYYRNTLKQNGDLLTESEIPLIFIINSFDIESKHNQSPWTEFPKGIIFIPKKIYIKRKDTLRMITIDSKNTSYDIEKNRSNKIKFINDSEMSKQTFLSMIDESMPMIKNNQVSKVVLSREKKNKFNFNNQKQSLFLYKAESNFPECTTFLYDFKNHGVFFGITPETLFKTKQKQFYSEAIAGTFQTNDDLISLDKTKELDEHNFVVNYINDKISKFSDDINFTNDPFLVNLNLITHLKTEFKSTLKSKIDPFDIIHNLHPTPAVCGTPKKAAMEIIRKLESHNRGWYSGTLGWIDNNYNSHFIVSIRSALSVDKTLFAYAGCGITKNSNKEKEYHESEIKFNSILSILNDE